MTELSQRIFSITGHTSDINEALDELENVKQAVSELYDDNQALDIINRRLQLCLTLAETSMKAMEKESGMFISEKTRGKMNQFFEQLEKTQSAIVQSQMMKMQ